MAATCVRGDVEMREMRERGRGKKCVQGVGWVGLVMGG